MVCEKDVLLQYRSNDVEVPKYKSNINIAGEMEVPHVGSLIGYKLLVANPSLYHKEDQRPLP